MWATIPQYEDQPVIELTPATDDAVLFGYGAATFNSGFIPTLGEPRYSATSTAQTQTFYFKDSSIGAVHLALTAQAFFSGTVTAEDRLKIKLGGRYSFVIRARRHNVVDSGSVGDAIILGTLIRTPDDFAPLNVFYFEAALQDGNSDVAVRRIYPSQADMFVSVGYFYDDAHLMHAYANVSAAPNVENKPRSDYGLRTYCMRMIVDADDAMGGDRSIEIRRNPIGLTQGFRVAAAHYGPLLEWQPFRPITENDRRSRANTCVGSLRSPAVNFAYPARQNDGDSPNSPFFKAEVVTIDCAGDSFFDSRRYSSTDQFSNRFYVAALGEHPDGSKAFSKPDVQWNSNLTESHDTNGLLAKLQLDAPAGFLVPVFQNFPFDSLAITGLAGNTSGNGNNEYIGSQEIDWTLDPDGFAPKFIRLNLFAGISAVESIEPFDAETFSALELETDYRLELTVFLVQDTGRIYPIINIDNELTSEQFSALKAGQSVEVLEVFNNKNVTIKAVGSS